MLEPRSGMTVAFRLIDVDEGEAICETRHGSLNRSVSRIRTQTGCDSRMLRELLGISHISNLISSGGSSGSPVHVSTVGRLSIASLSLLEVACHKEVKIGVSCRSAEFGWMDPTTVIFRRRMQDESRACGPSAPGEKNPTSLLP